MLTTSLSSTSPDFLFLVFKFPRIPLTTLGLMSNDPAPSCLYSHCGSSSWADIDPVSLERASFAASSVSPSDHLSQCSSQKRANFAGLHSPFGTSVLSLAHAGRGHPPLLYRRSSSRSQTAQKSSFHPYLFVDARSRGADSPVPHDQRLRGGG